MISQKFSLGRYKDYLVLNRILLASIFSAMIISALFSQAIRGQSDSVNASLTIAVSYLTYYTVFGILYYRSNKEKYLSNGFVNGEKLRKDFVKILTSVGIAEIVYLVSRWFLHYYLLGAGNEPFIGSIMAHMISASLFVLAMNFGVSTTKLYK